MIATAAFHELRLAPKELLLGSPNPLSDAQCVIDELLVLGRPLAEAEVYGAFQMQKEYSPLGAERDLLQALAGEFKPIPLQAAGADDNGLYTVNEPYSVYFSTEPLKLDGEFNESIWTHAQPLPPFERWGAKKDGAEPIVPTQVKAVYDSRSLWFQVVLNEPDMANVRVTKDQRDLNIYEDDCFEVLLDSGNSPETTWHVIVNSLGFIYDSKAGDKKFDLSGAKAVAKKGADSWTLELMIPFGDFGKRAPMPGEQWGFRCGRERKKTRENSSYPHTTLGLDIRANFAKMLFCGTPTGVSAVECTVRQKEFMPGMNKLAIDVVNRGAARKLTFTARILNADGTYGKENKEEMDAGADSKGILELKVPVMSLLAAQIALECADEKGTLLWRGGLPAGFVPTTLESSAMISNAMSDIMRWRAVSEAVNMAFGKNLGNMSTACLQFDDKIREAVVSGKFVSAEDCAKQLAVLNGMKQYFESRRMVIEETSPWDDGSPSGVPLSIYSVEEIQFKQGVNEWESKAIDITGILPGDVTEWRIGQDDFYNAQGKRVPRNVLMVYQMPFVRNGAGRLVTDPLYDCDGNCFTLLPGRTRRFWLALHSRGMAPGKYESWLTVKPADVQAAPRSAWPRIRITVEILPFTIPETPDFPMDAFLWSGGSTPIVDEMPLIGFMKRFHINHIATDRFRYDWGKPATGMGNLGAPKKTDDSPWVPFDASKITANDAFLKAVRQERMKLLFHWNICRNPAWVRLMSDHLHELGFTDDDYLFSGFHDEFLVKGYNDWLPFHQAVTKESPNVRFNTTLVTTPPPEGFTDEQLLDIFRYIKVPVIYESWLWPENQERTTRMRRLLAESQGLHPWIYRCSTGAQSLPLIPYYRLGPMLAKLCGVKGIAYWCAAVIYGHPSMRNGRKVTITPESHADQADPEGRWFEGVCFWHPSKILLPTRRLMALVEGLEDIAMIDALEKKSPGHPLTARETLLELHQKADGEKLAEWREKMLKTLIEK